ncbi:TPA: hypothetical protein ACGXDT_001658 [Streptococcus pyogenes]|uniref:hypothetical protein n=1 Tax=Streptococcus pyogenes TaxID=1314 RepID=UPI000DFF216A|nr:hypothetical protein [Streptococcus pyogenes]HER4599743.1 hypothetical protein [Streptococcus pyogenes NGAS606]HER4727845.1 hypothetical protein [Streptococcus pyogenes NGAS312]SUO66196.1 phage protein [Streptococcus pyogenes]VED83895.1 phage protein [Streptococcus pyogenes]VGQ36861.1 phage protein [Streptococcus pyogenes]
MNLEELTPLLNSIDDFETVILHSLIGDFVIDHWIEPNRKNETLIFMHNDQTTELKLSAILGTSTIPKSL